MPLKYSDSVVLVGGGPVSEDMLASVKDRTGIFVAADGGADALQAMGVIPDAVIGDMDSLSDAARDAIPSDRFFAVAEQDSTDFDKAVRGVDAPLIYALGFTGGRLDHELAALHVLVRYSHRAIILLGEEDLTIHLPERIELDLPSGTRVSLFPLDAITVGLTGLRWSFDALSLHPMRKIGTSNEVACGPVGLTSDGAGGLLIVPRAALEALVSALSNADLHSPLA